MPLMQLKMLVLPAPLGPMMAKKSPALISRLTPARAATPPKLRCRFSRARSAIRSCPPGCREDGVKRSWRQGASRAGRLHLPQARVVEHRKVHAPRSHPLADLLEKFGKHGHLVLGRVATQPCLARDPVGVDLRRRGGAALDGEPE